MPFTERRHPAGFNRDEAQAVAGVESGNSASDILVDRCAPVGAASRLAIENHDRELERQRLSSALRSHEQMRDERSDVGQSVT